MSRGWEEREAYARAGYRERYAMDNGEREVMLMSGNRVFRYSYPDEDEYQDANGATYDVVTKSWIN